jgi:hypothetical protein
MSKSGIISTATATMDFLPHPGEPFSGWKTNASIWPRNLDDADLLTHLEGDSRVRTYASLDPETSFQCRLSSILPDSIWYHVEHEAGSYVYLLFGRTERAGAEATIQYLSDTIIQQGRRLVLLDPHDLRREPRWTNLRQILSCRRYVISLIDKFRILDCVDIYGSIEVDVCAAMCQSSEDPIGAVLRLVADGSLVLNLDQQLSLTSLLCRPRVWEDSEPGSLFIDKDPSDVTKARMNRVAFCENSQIRYKRLRIVPKKRDTDGHC